MTTVAAGAAADVVHDKSWTKLSGELGGAGLGGRFFAVFLALVFLLRLELASLRLLLERLDASGLPLLLVDRLHQNTLVLELVTLASQVAVGVGQSEQHSNGQNDTQTQRVLKISPCARMWCGVFYLRSKRRPEKKHFESTPLSNL